MKKIRYFLLLCFAVVAITASVHAETIADLIPLGDFATVQTDNGEAWQLSKEQGSLYMGVPDDIVFRNPDRNVAVIEVSYYDDFDGYFTVAYDVNNGKYPKAIETNVTGGKTNQLKTKSFKIYDGYFGNNLENGSDIRIRYYGASNDAILKVFNVSFTLLDTVNPLDVAVSTGTAGNILFDGDDKELDITLKNKTTNRVGLNIRYEVIAQSREDVLGYTERDCVIEGNSLSNSSLRINSGRYGVYNLKVSVSDAEGKYEGEWLFPFSQAVRNDSVSQHMGINAGLMFDGRDYTKAIPLSKKAGFGLLRHGYSQEARVNAEGEPEKAKSIRQTANDSGLRVLHTFNGNNTLAFSGVKENTLPQNNEQREAFAQYVYDALEDCGDEVAYIEIWNEPDISCAGESDSGWGNKDPQGYALLLKAVYQKVKPDFPNIKICGICGHDILKYYLSNWTIEVLEADTGDGTKGHQWMDVISVHHYLTRTADFKNSTKRIDELINENISILDDWLKTNGVSKEIIHTEFGVNGIITEYTDERHAAVLSQYLLSLSAYRSGEKFFIYDLSNDSDNRIDSEGSFGLTHASWYRVPYAAKPAFTAISYMNSLLGDYKSAEVVEQSNDATVYKFTRGNGKKVYALYSQSEAENYTFDPDEKVTFFDAYGNVISSEENGAGYSLTLGVMPIYAVEGAKDTVPDDKPMLFAEPEFVYEITDGIITVKAYFPSGDAEETVVIKVVDGNGHMVQLQQLNLDSEKKCSFRFKGDEWQDYKIVVGTKESEYIGYAYKEGTGTLNISVRTADGQPVTSKKAWENSLKIYASAKNGGEKDFVVLCAAFKDKRFKGIRSIDVLDMVYNETDDMYTVSVNGKDFDGADEVKFFVFKSLDTMLPLTGRVDFK